MQTTSVLQPGGTRSRRRSRAGKSINQLKGAARRAAIEHLQELHGGDWFEAEEITEMFKDVLERDHGMPGMTVYWSLGHCQGDGVAFDGELDVWEMAKHDKWLDGHLKAHQVLWTLGDCDDGNNPDLVTPYVYCRHGGRHYHWNSTNVECDEGSVRLDNWPDWYDQFATDMREHLAERMKEISRTLERLGYDAIDHQTSEEYVVDHAEANKLEFSANGELL